MELVRLTNEEFKKIAKVVYDRTGIHLEDSKLSLLSNRLRKRLRALNFDTFEEYYKLIQSKNGFEQEEPHFLSAVTTNETYFFRNDSLWKSFCSDLIPHFVKEKSNGQKHIRIWSAASSTGAEAYTAAIVLRESLPDFANWNVTIIGSDISKNVLDQAKSGKYNGYAVSRMDKDRIARWFHPAGDDSFEVCDEIKKMVRFQFHNLRDPFPNMKFDLVFVRNVLMYFDMEMKKRVIHNVIESLMPGGHLIVGDVDPIRTIPELRDQMTLEYIRPGTYWNNPDQSSSEQSKARLVKA